MMPKVFFKSINAINSTFKEMIHFNTPNKGRDLIISEDDSLFNILFNN